MEENGISTHEQDEIDPFTAFMFGTGRDPGKMAAKGFPSLSQKGLDYDRLMTSIDNFIDSVNNLKPLLQKFHPMIKQLRKKK